MVGAGPYGLSVGAHLRSQRATFRIFGHPMHSWATEMPKGMLLKSEGFASDLFDPEARFPLRRYCEDKGIAYADVGVPVDLETFVSYGRSFQAACVPTVERRTLTGLDWDGSIFHLRFEDGGLVKARKVVLAVGLSHFRRVPPQLAHLPNAYASHSADHSDPARFKGRSVVVIGGGASAIDLAALLAENGADVCLAARQPAIRINAHETYPRPLTQRLTRPISVLGTTSWPFRAYCAAPSTFRHLPESMRLRKVETMYGPAGGWFMKDRVAGIPIHAG
ncbi:MAG: NAD(P)-binding domain-containing protein, partial [Gammaproteobacteria bacterium]